MEIVIFARYWEPGAVKTRLCPPLRPIEASRLSRLFLDVLVARLETVIGLSPVIAFEPDRARQSFARRYPAVALEPQCGAELGAKLVHVASRRKNPCLITGSDCPTTPLDSFRLSAQALRGDADVVIAPTEDGGTHILGAQPKCAHWFDGIPWSSGKEGRVLEERARNNGWRCTRLPMWYDVDRASDIPRALRDLEACVSRGEFDPAIIERDHRFLADLKARIRPLPEGSGTETTGCRSSRTCVAAKQTQQKETTCRTRTINPRI